MYNDKRTSVHQPTKTDRAAISKCKVTSLLEKNIMYDVVL